MEVQEENNSLSLITQILAKAIGGNDTLGISSADALALSYLNNKDYKSNDERVDSMINWETTKNFTSGFITGLGGLITLPVTLPSSLVATWVIQARLSGAIAKIYGYDLNDDKVKLMIILSILGDSGKEVLKEFGINAGKQITMQVIKNLAPKIIKEINKQVGYKLITRAGQKSILNTLGRAIPLVGGAIGGTIDAISCQTIGSIAKGTFRR